MSPSEAGTLFLHACALDVAVRKPGNVSAASPGHGMDAGMFLASARAAMPLLFARGARVGERIEGAMQATLAVAGCNTNLGILLLCAPLALALERSEALRDAAALQHALRAVLDQLDIEDARCTFRAIAAAHPGGLGRAADQDVADAPTVTLLGAMQLAADRDRIAAQYASGYEDLFVTGLSSLQPHVRPDAPVGAQGVQAVYLGFLGRWADSHIVRKFGESAAQAVTNEARPWLTRAQLAAPFDEDPAFAAWDESLKRRGLNPGTSADLTVATLFLAGALGRTCLLASS